jgi:sporulation protein YlmC with PRC-barrel domain
MLRSIKQLYGDKLSAADGEVGRVKDFYFDDEYWAVRYVVVDTGPWLAGRLVLISPHSFGSFYQNGDSLLVELTRKQIEKSPPIDAHKPVSRQYEEDYYQYYGWPNYWDGLELWGGAGYPVAPLPYSPRRTGPGESSTDEDSHLRSSKSVAGYHIQTRDGSIGRVTDFMIDDKSWTIRYLVVETGHWFYGKEIVISPSDIERISYEESMVFVTVTQAAIRDAAEYHMPRAEYQDARELSESNV